MASNKKYWQSVEELKDSSIVETLSKNEFVEEIPTDEFLGDKETLENSSTSRRDFLKYVLSKKIFLGEFCDNFFARAFHYTQTKGDFLCCPPVEILCVRYY